MDLKSLGFCLGWTLWFQGAVAEAETSRAYSDHQIEQDGVGVFSKRKRAPEDPAPSYDPRSVRPDAYPVFGQPTVFKDPLVEKMYADLVARQDGMSFQELYILKSRAFDWWNQLSPAKAADVKLEFLRTINLLNVEQQIARVNGELGGLMYKKKFGKPWQDDSQQAIVGLKLESLRTLRRARQFLLKPPFPQPSYLLRDLSHIDDFVRVRETALGQLSTKNVGGLEHFSKKIINSKKSIKPLANKKSELAAVDPELRFRQDLDAKITFLRLDGKLEKIPLLQLQNEGFGATGKSTDRSSAIPVIVSAENFGGDEGAEKELRRALDSLRNHSLHSPKLEKRLFDQLPTPTKNPVLQLNDQGLRLVQEVGGQSLGLATNEPPTMTFRDLSELFAQPRSQTVIDEETFSTHTTAACVGFALSAEVSAKVHDDVSPWYTYSLINSLERKDRAPASSRYFLNVTNDDSDEKGVTITRPLSGGFDVELERKRQENAYAKYLASEARLQRSSDFHSGAAASESGTLVLPSGELVVTGGRSVDDILAGREPAWVKEQMAGINDIEGAIRNLTSNPLPPHRVFPNAADISKPGEIPERKYQPTAWGATTLNRALEVSTDLPQINNQKNQFRVADTYYQMKRLVDEGATPAVLIDTDSRVINEDWIDLSYKDASFDHAINVVGYGDMGVNPKNGQVEPYLIVRDSLSTKNIHYKVAASDFAAHADMVLRLKSVEILDTKPASASYVPPAGPRSISDDAEPEFQLSAEHLDRMLNVDFDINRKSLPYRKDNSLQLLADPRLLKK